MPSSRPPTEEEVLVLITQYRGEAVSLVKRVAGQFRLGVPVHEDDLVSIALEALWKAARDFNPLRGAKFWSYAYGKIRWRVLDEIRQRAKRASHEQPSDLIGERMEGEGRPGAGLDVDRLFDRLTAGLGNRSRYAVFCRCLLRQSDKMTAWELGISTRSARQLIERSIAWIRKNHDPAEFLGGDDER
jgi:RNA polymerase sigma factor (sigma-70 family)